MSSLQDKIQADIKEAMKARAELELSTLRMLKSDMQYELTKTGAKELSDEDVLTLIKRAVKKRQDAAEQFVSGGRAELAEKEKAEMLVLQRYLPAEASVEQIEKAIDEVVSAMAAKSPSDTGKVMGAVMGKLKGQNANGALVKELVAKKLNA